MTNQVEMGRSKVEKGEEGVGERERGWDKRFKEDRGILTNFMSLGETSSLESITFGGWFEAGSLPTGLDTPRIEATCELNRRGKKKKRI